MLRQEDVAADVGDVMRRLVIENTPFTGLGPDADPSGYRDTLVPGAAPWDGWNAPLRTWADLYREMALAVRSIRLDYAAAVVTTTDIQATRNSPLYIARQLLVGKVMAANAAPHGVRPVSLG